MEPQPGRPVAEEDVARAWGALRRGSLLRTQEGERIEVWFSGLRNPGAGPDFRRAVFRSERGRVVRGDVEVHLAATGWDAHGHGDDPRYRNVVLHVVARDDRLTPVLRPGGGRAPALVIGALTNTLTAGGPLDPCGAPGAGSAARGLLETVRRLGGRRFNAKVRWWRGRVAGLGPDAALFMGLVAALGHGEDRAPFQQVAAALPWPALGSALALAPPHERVAAAETWLLGTAGLLGPAAPSPPSLPSLGARWAALGAAPALAAEHWPRGGRRPNAAPWRRLAGLGALAARWSAAGGPAEALQRAVEGVVPGRWVARLRAHFRVDAAAAGVRGPALIGNGAADGLAVNVALPLLGALAALSGDAASERRVEAAYAAYPGLEPDAVVRRLGAALELSPFRLGACLQQGLHQLHRGYCQRGRQAACPCCRPGRDQDRAGRFRP